MNTLKKNSKGTQHKNKYFINALKTVFIGLVIFSMGAGCKKKDDTTTTTNPTPTYLGYQQINLVADTAGFSGARIDTNLSNAWGIAIGQTGAFAIASNHKGLITFYDRNGAQLATPVATPFGGKRHGGSPSGIVYNNTTGFMGNGFIIADENGTISTWSSTDSVTVRVNRSTSQSVYKGIALANDSGTAFIYATDFHNAKVDVFDANFNLVTSKPFMDPGIPIGFAPFNIQNIGNQLYVTYAKQKGPDNKDDMSGVGNGYVDIFTAAGVFVKRFASQGQLNSPWAVVQPPAGFGLKSGAILVGNFGDGRINVYDANGVYQSQLSDHSSTIAIKGLWGLAFPQNNIPAGDQNQLFFTAGPSDETHGLFGYIRQR